MKDYYRTIGMFVNDLETFDLSKCRDQFALDARGRHPCQRFPPRLAAFGLRRRRLGAAALASVSEVERRNALRLLRPTGYGLRLRIA
jgi:hypothetical protein